MHFGIGPTCAHVLFLASLIATNCFGNSIIAPQAWCADGVVSKNPNEPTLCCTASCGNKCGEPGCGQASRSLKAKCCSGDAKRRPCANATDTGCICAAAGCPGPAPPTPPSPPSPPHNGVGQIHLYLDKPISETLPQYVSVTLDQFDLLPASFRDNSFDWNSSRLIRLASNLAPSFLRMGGSDQEHMEYDDSFFKSQWPVVVNFARALKAAGVGVIWGLASR